MIYYYDKDHSRHEFEISEHALSGIMLEFGEISGWLDSLGICYSRCGWSAV